MMARLNMLAMLLLVTRMCCICGQETDCIENDVILDTADGYFANNSEAGRVEICYCTGGTCSWATINAAGSAWSWPNTLVACRQLGYSTSRNPIVGSSIPESNHNSSNPIYPYHFNCDGTESELSQCQQVLTDPNTVSHRMDAYVQCDISTTIAPISVRLAGSTVDSEGVVEVYLNGWVTICPSRWGDADAGVVCRELGYEGGTATTIERDTFHGSVIRTHPSITRVDCAGSETVLGSCGYIVDNVCSFTTLAGVTCQESSSSEGSVRLVSTGGLYDRVEVLYNGRWGTVCNVQWSVLDGEVVCRELGRDIVAVDVAAPPDSFTSSSSRAIWITEYGCGGDESELTSCATPYAIGYAPGCSHSVDAALTCNIHANDHDASSGLTSGQIAGIVTGCIAAVVLIYIFIHFHEKKKKGQLKWPKISLPKISLPRVSLPRRQQRRIYRVEVQDAIGVQPMPSAAEEVLPPPSYEDIMERPPQYTEKDTGPFATKQPPGGI